MRKLCYNTIMKGSDNMEKKKLKFSDWWYYYKWYVIGACFVLAAIVITLYINSNKTGTDMYIECASDNCLTVEQARAVAKTLNDSGVIDDVDGDGMGLCKLNTYQTGMNGKNDAKNAEATQLKMLVGEAAIVFTDENVIKGYENQKTFKNISYLAEKFPERKVITNESGDVVGICIDDCELFRQNNIRTNGMYLTMRNIPGDLKKDKKLVKMFENADKVAEYILK